MTKKHITTLLAMALASFGVSAQGQANDLSCDSVSGGLCYPILYKSSAEYADRMNMLDYEYVLDDIEQRRAKAKRRRKTLPELDSIEAECKRCLLMLKSSDQVLVLDSIVVDKHDLLKAYGYGNEVGTIKLSADGRTSEFVTERGNISYRSEVIKGDTLGRLCLVSSYVEDGHYAETQQLQGFDMDGDANYPFMMSDGMTFYFAARANEGLGNYDLYATRYDSESASFYRPENMGFPFNSYANDYLLVIDEHLGVGWFASDRYQPEGKVCVYTFVPNDSRNPVNYDLSPSLWVRQKAMLAPISVTWTPENEQTRIRLRQQMMLKHTDRISDGENKDFTLVINDYYTYTRFSDFKNKKAATLCHEWLEKQKELQTKKDKLDKMRTDYHRSPAKQKQTMRQSILTLEQEYEQLVIEVRDMEKKVRNMEIEYRM